MRPSSRSRSAGFSRAEVGPSREFRLFFRLKPGHEDDLRAAMRALLPTPPQRTGDPGSANVAMVHEARFVLFDGLDGGLRLLLATTLEGPPDEDVEHYASKLLQLFESILQHVEGYEVVTPPGG